MRIKPFTSFALDVLRSGAAIAVVFNHLGMTHLVPGANLAPGHLMVICFFVLSGFVIAATSHPDKTTGQRYFAARLSRLWSVALPCLLIALVLEIIGRSQAPAHYKNFDSDFIFLRYALTAMFLNENWFFSAGPRTNIPLWSLAYEAWYYIFFGVVVFVRSQHWRFVILVLLMAAAGPKILLLLPVWILGVLTCKLCERPKSLVPYRWWISGISAGIFVLFLLFQIEWPYEAGGVKPWYFSGAWASDFVFACGVAGIILSIDLLWGNNSVPPGLERFIREVAGVSFTMYLLHFPLMVFAAGVLSYDPSNPVHVGSILLGIFTLIYVIGKVIEPQRKVLTPVLQSIFSRQRV